MTNYARRGNEKDVRSRELLEIAGYVVGSRRHVPGPGDLVAVKIGTQTLLVEVKACEHVWQNFRREDRQEMLRYCHDHGLLAVIHWWKPRARVPELIYPADWPMSEVGIVGRPT